jgi:tRNA A37 N6-isopentenylltransferase MiaA
MLEQGLVEETRTLLEAGFGRRSAPGSTLGYDRVLDMLEGTLDAAELQDRIEADTWRFARRQRNMMRRLGPVSSWDGLDAGPVLAALAELEE